MQGNSSSSRQMIVIAAAIALGFVVGLIAAPGAAGAAGGRAPSWLHETGALAGTSETFVDMRADGSYYDPSLGRRVYRNTPSWLHETGALAGTSETFVDMRADGSYYDPSLGRRVYRKAQPGTVEAAPSQGFDWAQWVIGGAFALALALLAIGSAIVQRRRSTLSAA